MYFFFSTDGSADALPKMGALLLHGTYRFIRHNSFLCHIISVRSWHNFFHLRHWPEAKLEAGQKLS